MPRANSLPLGACQPGVTVDCNDGVDCTTDSCDEAANSCENVPNNDLCSDGLYCTGIEVCDSENGCQPGTPVVCNDNGAFCDGKEICDDASGSCISSGDPCAGSAVCDEEGDQCQGAFASSLKRMFLIWQQGR